MPPLLNQKQGNVTVVFALSLVTLLSASGGALDLYSAQNLQSRMQDALDASVLSGLRHAEAQRSTEATTVFKSNIGRNDIDPAYTTDATTLAGTASADSPNQFLGLIGVTSFKVTVKATAAGTKSTSGPCIQVLDQTGSQALLVNSGAKVNAANCEIQVRSKASPAAIFNSGSNLAFSKICIEGANIIRNSTTVPNLTLSCPTQADNWASSIPSVASQPCTQSNGNFNDAAVSLSPGVYCGWFNFNNNSAKVTFAPGLYVIRNGGWNVNGGTWSGNGVTFYFEDTSKIQFNSGISADLRAPSSGTYKDILFFEKTGLSKSDFIFNNAVANRMDGLIWLPSRNVTFNAQSKMSSDHLSMVMNRLILNNTDWTLEPMTAPSGTSSGLSNIRLIQ